MKNKDIIFTIQVAMGILFIALLLNENFKTISSKKTLTTTEEKSASNITTEKSAPSFNLSRDIESKLNSLGIKIKEARFWEETH